MFESSITVDCVRSKQVKSACNSCIGLYEGRQRGKGGKKKV